MKVPATSLLVLTLAAAPFPPESRIVIETPTGPFATFHYGEYARVPYVWPLIGPGGVELTRAFPMEKGRPGEAADHPHHTSLWFAHGSVNGHDFWHGGDGSRIATEPLAESRLQGTEVTTNTQHRWVAPDGVELLSEARKMVFRDVENGRVVDFELTLTALEDVVFGDTKEGTFALRLNPALRLRGDVARGRALNSEGIEGRAIWGKRARWVDYSGPVDGNEIGVAVFDHPENLRHPTWWHARDYGLVAANPFGVHDFEGGEAGSGDHQLARGEALSFRFRVYLHEGPGDAETLDAAWRAWAEPAEEAASEGDEEGD